MLAPSHAATDNILASMSKWIDDKSLFYRHGDHSKITDPYVRQMVLYIKHRLEPLKIFH